MEKLVEEGHDSDIKRALELVDAEDDVHGHEQRKKLKSEDYAKEYGLDNELVIRTSDTHEFVICIAPKRDEVGITICRPTSQVSSWPRHSVATKREDGFEAVELMFSGKVEIKRPQQEGFYVSRPLVNPIAMHHNNHFGPERGLVIGRMIQLLSQELIELHEQLRRKADGAFC